MTFHNMDIPHEQIADFCHRWKIGELALFGSALRENFTPDSDIDILVTFAPDADWSLLDHIQIEEELTSLLGRTVDLVSRRAIERSDNWIRRQAILETTEVLYVEK